MGIIFRREFKACFRTFKGYLYIAAFSLAAAIFFLIYNLMNSTNSLVYIFEDMLFVSVFLLPLLVMLPRFLVRKRDTEKLFDILPFTSRDMVLGKFFADYMMFFISSLVTLSFAFVIDAIGNFSYSIFFAAYFSYLIFGAFLLAVCRYFAVAFKNQIAAATVYILVMVMLFVIKPLSAFFPQSALFSMLFFIAAALIVSVIIYFTTKQIVVSAVLAVLISAVPVMLYFVRPALLESSAESLISFIAVFDIISYGTVGIFDLGAVLMFLSFAVFMNYLTIRSDDKKKLREVGAHV